MNERLKGKLRRALEEADADCWLDDGYGRLDIEAIIAVVEEVMDGKMRVVDRT